jgi:hypothetical protein
MFAFDFGFDRMVGSLYKKQSIGQDGIPGCGMLLDGKGALAQMMKEERGEQWHSRKKCKFW